MSYTPRLKKQYNNAKIKGYEHMSTSLKNSSHHKRYYENPTESDLFSIKEDLIGNYKGDKKFGQYNGKGICKFKNGDIYHGEWKNGKFDGAGTYYYRTGEKYYGNFVSGKRSGFGTMTFRDNKTYKGYWKNDMQEGKGKLIISDTVLHGTWHENHINDFIIKKL